MSIAHHFVPHTHARVSRRVVRLAAVVAAAAATVVVWTIATSALDLTVRAPVFDASASNPEIGAVQVALTTTVAGLAAWTLLAVAERLSPARGPRVWLALALLALLVSFGGPLSGTGVGASNRLVLASMHVVAAAVLIPLLYRSSRQADA